MLEGRDLALKTAWWVKCRLFTSKHLEEFYHRRSVVGSCSWASQLSKLHLHNDIHDSYRSSLAPPKKLQYLFFQTYIETCSTEVAIRDLQWMPLVSLQHGLRVTPIGSTRPWPPSSRAARTRWLGWTDEVTRVQCVGCGCVGRALRVGRG